MENLPDVTRKATWLPPSGGHERTWLLERLEMVMGAYKDAKYHNLEVFVSTAIANLELYSKEIIEYVTDPKTGIQARSQWPPSIAEIRQACEAEANWRWKLSMQSTAKIGPPLPEVKASGIIGDGSPGTIYTATSFDEAVKKHGRPFGAFEQGREKPYNAD